MNATNKTQAAFPFFFQNFSFSTWEIILLVLPVVCVRNMNRHRRLEFLYIYATAVLRLCRGNTAVKITVLDSSPPALLVGSATWSDV